MYVFVCSEYVYVVQYMQAITKTEAEMTISNVASDEFYNAIIRFSGPVLTPCEGSFGLLPCCDLSVFWLVVYLLKPRVSINLPVCQQTRSKLVRTMLLSSPGHRHPWCWPWRQGRSLFYARGDFSCLCHVNVIKCKYMFVFPLKK